MGFWDLLSGAVKDMPFDTRQRNPSIEITKKLLDIENKEVKNTLSEANDILSSAQDKTANILKSSRRLAGKATKALEKNRTVMILLLDELECEYKPIQQAFSKKEKSGYFKPISYNSQLFKNQIISSTLTASDFEPIFDLIMKYTPYLKTIRANKYLKNAKSYSLEVDSKVAKINSEILSFQCIIEIEKEALLILNKLENKIQGIKPKIKVMLNKKALSEDEKKTTLFLGQAMNILIDSLNCTVLNKNNRISETYLSKLNKIRTITLKIEEIFV